MKPRGVCSTSGCRLERSWLTPVAGEGGSGRRLGVRRWWRKGGGARRPGGGRPSCPWDADALLSWRGAAHVQQSLRRALASLVGSFAHMNAPILSVTKSKGHLVHKVCCLLGL